MRAAAVSTLLAIGVAAVASLVCGAGFLDAVLPGGLPAGNAVAALGLASFAGIPVLLGARGSLLRRAALATFGAAVGWLPVSIALAGNLELNFAGRRGAVWLGFSLVVQVAVLCTLVWSAVACLLAVRGRGDAG